MTSNLADAVRTLDEEPLFHASMASRELFHTNLIRWLSRKHPAAARVLVTGLGLRGADENLVVEREVRLPDRILANGQKKQQKIDLYLHTESSRLWIEVKIGAIPAADQLTEYSDAIAKAWEDPGEHVLISLHKPSAVPRGWTWLSLTDLAEVFEAAHAEIDDRFDRELVLHEVNLLRQLVVLAAAVDPATHLDEPWFFPKGTRKVINDARAGTIVQKARVSALLNHLGPKISQAGLDSEAGFSNGTGNITCWCEGEKTIFGWQLQGNSYRLYGSHVDGVTAHELREKIHPDWYDFTDATRSLRALLMPRGKGAGKFGTHWAYEYRRLPADVSTKDVVGLLTSEIRRLQGFADTVK
ncbi:PD-(D/E)XK nuclease family protein [Nocardioides sp. WL0053]|uniref:PD-(D/E)XK nuclease family protein n=1 Tax=Nocardioides jiangsuensis TaxID=2866161 RepID=A0ABS7RGT7_9ACTN|nr:PD-(D/E)XK nuclease family protein [Nocardioides jiangsuensis]MBY9074252.1 PD-(D/E)XK nuclease family protein [Nocardioides jiangsuensis]